MQLGSFIDMQKQVAYLKAGYIDMQLFFFMQKASCIIYCCDRLKLGTPAEEKKSEQKQQNKSKKCHNLSQVLRH